MPLKPKFRLFGAPNGSGKKACILELKEKGIIHTEVYVNADWTDFKPGWDDLRLLENLALQNRY
jgi:hypothetical protein